jgi:hypothetical protein
LQAGKNDTKEFKLPGELGGAELENKIIMLTDDTQLFIKYERYVEKSFNVFSKYEMASDQELISIKQKILLWRCSQ